MTPLPIKQSQETVAARFQRLASNWHAAVEHLSSSTARINHPAYQEIIALGPDVIPLLLRDLQDNLTHWFWALQKITGTNPVPESDAGNVPKMAEAWLRWGQEHGYQW